ncbi:MAG: formimidoylglutamate deiminase [Deltaproteobacteria bacterium]|nr:formimidoylglutamate deiminase [Deltaproteobacteria bacterium]
MPHAGATETPATTIRTAARDEGGRRRAATRVIGGRAWHGRRVVAKPGRASRPSRAGADRGMVRGMSVVLPGFANVHSHAFQRLMRGAAQRRDPARADTFWSWRSRMYELAGAMDLAGLEAAARLTYRECLEAGYTAVGEFHYLHHDRDGRPWPDPVAAARAHIRAAREVGIRVALLHTVYACGGIGEPLTPAQRRFATAALGDVTRALDLLAAEDDGRRVRIGLAIHSIRAVPREWLGPLAAEARARRMPIHAHVAEQPAEVAACRAAYGLSPVALLAAEGVVGPDVTFVHATWLDDDDIQILARSGTRVALCPTTEADLGDGIARVAELYRAGVPLCVGSDSHAVIDALREVAMCEQLARLRSGERCVIADGTGAVAPALVAIGHDHGYAALGLPADGDRVTLAGERFFAAVDDPAAAALTGGHAGLVDRVEVDGVVVVSGGRASSADECLGGRPGAI